MKIFKIEIENFRLLKSFKMDLEGELTLVIGKNNTGKSSILTILDKFLNPTESKGFSINDFNMDFKDNIIQLIKEANEEKETGYCNRGIKLKLFIQYDENDNIANLNSVMMDLDLKNNFIVLGFEYVLNFYDYRELRKDYKKVENEISVEKFIDSSYSKYFKLIKKSIFYDYETGKCNEGNFINIDKVRISDIINFKYISAKRDVANKESNKTLSRQTARIYEKTESTEIQIQTIENFKNELTKTDETLTNVYKGLFSDVVEKVKKFGGISPSDSEIEIKSTLQHRELLNENTTVFYRLEDNQNYLPEHYNGLGYMNLISMILEIEILIREFKRKKDEKPADINLLFIEEPEAHTHPQMQYIFIKNIKALLKEGIKRDDGDNRRLQYIISTHSAHILADSDFDDVKYLIKEHNNVEAKNLKSLRKCYDDDEGQKQYQFLKQYLTISRAEIFFADKAVLIEGDTERILIPTFMKKMDIEASDSEELPLLSQNISIVEVGAHSHIFHKFIEFLGIKTLIITDIDSVDGNGKACKVTDGEKTSNSALINFFKDRSWQDTVNATWKDKIYPPNPKILIVYQTNELGYHARSFEDSFISINKDFVNSSKEHFRGLKNRYLFDENSNDAYYLAEHCINKKTHFALDILYHSAPDLSNWKIPTYIKEGLEWLRAD